MTVHDNFYQKNRAGVCDLIHRYIITIFKTYIFRDDYSERTADLFDFSGFKFVLLDNFCQKNRAGVCDLIHRYIITIFKTHIFRDDYSERAADLFDFSDFKFIFHAENDMFYDIKSFGGSLVGVFLLCFMILYCLIAFLGVFG